MSNANSRGLVARYDRLLWGTMNLVGIDESIGRKMITAVAIQFVAAMGAFALGIALVGFDRFLAMFSPTEMAAFGVMFVVAIVAMVNTVHIVRRDFVVPVRALQETAEHIAAGDLSDEVVEVDQADEIGALSRSFAEMHAYLELAAAQADAIGEEDFDAAVLDRAIPGRFGESLSRMETNLRARIDDLQSQRASIEASRRDLERTAADYQSVIARVAEGDLTSRLPTDTDNEAMASIATSLNAALEEWETTITSLSAFAREVADESADVTTSAGEVRNASEDISESIQEISMGVDREAERLDDAADQAENLSATIQEITASSDNVAALTEETATVGDDGREAAEAAIEEMHAIEARTTATVEAVEELTATIDEIGDITDVILDIADQTNILALNAGIEAARASEEGAGFAVVADEVKNLAEETKASAEDIEALITQVQAQSTATVEEIDAMTDRVAGGVETVGDATDAFERMAENVSNINVSIREVSEATADQAESTQDVVATVEDISAISDQTAVEAQTVAAAAQEQAATLNDVATNTDRLAENAHQLEERLQAFSVEDTVQTVREEPSPEDRSRVDGSGMEWRSVATDGGDD